MRRVFPCIQIENQKCVKSKKFVKFKYLGDPFNVLRIYNEKEVDELLICITDQNFSLEDNSHFLTKLAKQARMPLALSANITSPAQVEFLVSLGYEKIVLSSCLPSLGMGQFAELSVISGQQSLVAGIPCTFTGDSWKFYDWRNRCSSTPVSDILSQTSQMTFGEYFFYNVDRDGMKTGIDHDLIEFILNTIKDTNVSFAGGIASKNEIIELVDRYPGVGFGASSALALQGKFDAVLLSYI